MRPIVEVKALHLASRAHRRPDRAVPTLRRTGQRGHPARQLATALRLRVHPIHPGIQPFLSGINVAHENPTFIEGCRQNTEPTPARLDLQISLALPCSTSTQIEVGAADFARTASGGERIDGRHPRQFGRDTAASLDISPAVVQGGTALAEVEDGAAGGNGDTVRKPALPLAGTASTGG